MERHLSSNLWQFRWWLAIVCHGWTTSNVDSRLLRRYIFPWSPQTFLFVGRPPALTASPLAENITRRSAPLGQPLSLSLTHSLSLFLEIRLCERSAVAFACKLPKSNLGNLNKELEKCSHWSNRYYDFLVHAVSYDPGVINSSSFDMSEYVFHFLYLFIFLVQRDGETRRRRILLSNLQLIIKIIIFHRVIACDVLCVPLKGTCELFARSAASYQTG